MRSGRAALDRVGTTRRGDNGVMAVDPNDPGEAVSAFLAERHLASLTTLRPDGTPHVVPVGFSYDAERRLARVITSGTSRKALNIAARPGARVALCQIDGGRWLSIEGEATLSADPADVAEAERRYADRYQAPRQRADRVAIEIRVDRILGRA